jgi:hypothetical protein
MDINRRKLLGNATASATFAMVGHGMSVFGIGSALAQPDSSKPHKWHPLTRSLLERASRITRDDAAPDRAKAERTLRKFADASGWTKPLVIKWIDSPRDAFDHLSRFSLDALLDMGSGRFWRRSQSPVSPDKETFERAFEARMVANELLGAEEHDRLLMAPKLLTKSRAMSANVSDEEVFRVRAISSQIGWLETSMAAFAAQAVANVELLLSTGASEGSVAIDHHLKVFEVYEHGLMATWETRSELICVPMMADKNWF